MNEMHYRFPPASAYPLNRCLYALKSDDAFRARFLADAKTAMAEHGLDEEAQADKLLTKIATGGLFKTGVNQQAAR